MSNTVLDRPPAPSAEPCVPEAPTTRPRLSELMREGARVHPQGRVYLYDLNKGTTCALGAAVVGLLGPPWRWREPYTSQSLGHIIFEGTGVDLDAVVDPPPELGGGRHTLGTLIIRLNDGYRWSREKIADWLESIGY